MALDKAILVRLPSRDRELLKLSARAYRAPSVAWFVREMIGCMFNPARWQEFTMRMNSGAEQLTLSALEKEGVKRHVRGVLSRKPKRRKRE
jgi:hypothetical protein